MKMKLKTRIFIVLVLTLLLMLLSSSAIFNIFAESYIREQANRDLNEASALLDTLIDDLDMEFFPDDETLSEPLKLIRQLVRNRFLFSDENIFIMNDSGFVFTMSEDNTEEILITTFLLQNEELLQRSEPFPIDYENNSFYTLIKKMIPISIMNGML